MDVLPAGDKTGHHRLIQRVLTDTVLNGTGVQDQALVRVHFLLTVHS